MPPDGMQVRLPMMWGIIWIQIHLVGGMWGAATAALVGYIISPAGRRVLIVVVVDQNAQTCPVRGHRLQEVTP